MKFTKAQIESLAAHPAHASFAFAVSEMNLHLKNVAALQEKADQTNDLEALDHYLVQLYDRLHDAQTVLNYLAEQIQGTRKSLQEAQAALAQN